MNKLRKFAASIGILFVVSTPLLFASPAAAEPYLNTPKITHILIDGTTVTIDWVMPEDSGTPVERYAVMWTYDNQPGWGISSTTTEAVVTGLPETTNVTFWVRADNDTLGVYSAFSKSLTVPTGAAYVAPVIVPPVVTPPVVNPPVPPVVIPVDPVPPVVPVVPTPTPVPTPEPPVVKPPVPKTPEPPVVVPPPVQVPIDPPKQPEPSPQPPITQVDPATIDPTTLTPNDVVALQAVANTTLSTTPEGSPEYNQALEQLAVAAQADDIRVDPAVANTPVVGAAVVGMVNAVNALGNIGADMSPAHRKTAKKEVVAAVVVTGVAVQAAGVATSSAVASAGAAGSVSSRKKN